MGDPSVVWPVDYNEAEECLYCDTCGALITDYENDLFHFSGVFEGQQNNHIHVCAQCVKDYSIPMINFDELIT